MPLLIVASISTFAEGVYQTGMDAPQPLDSDTPLFVHAEAGDFLRFHFCFTEIDPNDYMEVNIYSTQLDAASGQYVDDTQLTSLSSDGPNIACDHPMTTPLPAVPVIGDQMQFQVPESGVYALFVDGSNKDDGEESDDDDFQRWDISVVKNAADTVDPTIDAGNLFSYRWKFETGSFSEEVAMTEQFYILVPGGVEDTNYVWMLDLQKLSGNEFRVVANDVGLDGRYSGSSHGDSVSDYEGKYPVYLSYPSGANPFPAPREDQSPGLSSEVIFLDSASADAIFSPDDDGIEETGTFSFTADVDGVYSIIIDTNADGVFGTGDARMSGSVKAGDKAEIEWDGTGLEDDELVAQGEYQAQVSIRLGEYHFIADDVETSGGGEQNGLTIMQALSKDEVIPTRVYWDDATYLGGLGGQSNLPEGVMSSLDETGPHRHTWGNFTRYSLGNKSHIDTYVYGLSMSSQLSIGVEYKDAPQMFSAGAALASTLEVPEGQLQVQQIDVQVNGADSDDHSFELLGTDSALFTITSTGALSFIADAAPDYEQPSDADTNNRYELAIKTTAANGRSSQQMITVVVTNVDDRVDTGIAGGALALPLLLLLGLVSVATRVQASSIEEMEAAPECHYANSFQQLNCWEVEGALGWATLTPETDNSPWSVNSEDNLGLGIMGRLWLHDQVGAELGYYSLGGVELTSAANQAQDINYSAMNLAASLWLKESSSRWNLFAKPGIALLSTNESSNVKQRNEAQFSIGAGASYRFSPQWSSKLGFDYFAADANLVSLSLAYRFGSAPVSRTEPIVEQPEKPEPLQAAEDTSQLKESVTSVVLPEDMVVYYQRDSYQLTPNAQQLFNMVVKTLNEQPELELTLIGYSSTLGSQQHNLSLSQSRAEHFAGKLRENGILSDRVRVQFKGELDQEESELSQRVNVEFGVSSNAEAYAEAP